MRIDQKQKAKIEENNLIQLMQEVVPEVSAIEAPYRLWRYDKTEDRFYYRIIGNQLKPYLSVTSFTQKILPTSPYLMRWYGDNGNDVAEYKKNLSAEYGTILHMEIAKAIKNNSYSFRELETTLMEVITEQYKYCYADWLFSLKKDLMSFFEFYAQQVVKVISLEIPVCSDNFDLAGTVDLVCQVQFDGKPVNAIVDFKSGRKGFFEAHELQLHCYKEIWNERFGDLFEVSHVFNWAPNAWRKKPTFKFKNQTNSSFAKTARARMRICNLEKWATPPASYFDITGEVQSLDEFSYQNHLITEDTIKKALERKKEEETPKYTHTNSPV